MMATKDSYRTKLYFACAAWCGSTSLLYLSLRERIDGDKTMMVAASLPLLALTLIAAARHLTKNYPPFWECVIMFIGFVWATAIMAKVVKF